VRSWVTDVRAELSPGARRLSAGRLLRYLTNQIRPTIINKILRRPDRATLFDYNMGQALMLLMETATQRRAGQIAEAEATEKHASAGRGSRLAGVGEQLLRRQSPAAALAARCSAISF
jgi:hypothetical protein